MDASVAHLAARAARLVHTLVPLQIQDPTEKTTTAVRHLFRLLPLSYPPASALLTSPHHISIRLVAVTELGLHPRGSLAGPLRLSATILVGRLTGSLLANPVTVSCEPLVNGPTFLPAENGKGQFEFSPDPSQWVRVLGSDRTQQSAFVRISAHGQDTCHDLVLGPFTLSPNSGGDDTAMIDVYRPFEVPGVPDLCLVREDWGLGIPGKVWDSAIVLSALLVSPARLAALIPPLQKRPLHIVDLSSGTGHLAALLHLSLKQPQLQRSHQSVQISCTDLPEAVPLLAANLAATPVEPHALPWGDEPAARALGPADLVIASDVVYQAELLPMLAATLAALVPPASGGRVVFGYKPRGLTSAEEDAFFVGALVEQYGFRVIAAEEQSGDRQARFGVVVIVLERP
ncbi:putative methyltransferase-domain-containing protein [Blastocladiella britannica]|nr:putative methyltransferase-domain-containing protein [Blastocladiella britannica]